jgi:hypothetical protein
MAADLRRVFGARFVALVVGGSGAPAAFATEIRADDLDAIAPLTETWVREGAGVPLLMTPAEFHRTLDVFPAEYQSLIDRHVVVDGRDPFEGAAVAVEDLRRACEAQARGHLIHLRQGWISSDDHHGVGGAAHDVGGADGLMAQSAAPLRALLQNLARLDEESPDNDKALAAFAERRTGMPADLVTAVFEAEDGHLAARAAAARLPEYLRACEQLWNFVDTWRAR